MKNVILSTMAAVLLSACASMGGMTQVQKIETMCSSAELTLKALKVAYTEGKLPMSVAQDVLKAVDIMRPVCTAPTPPTLSEAQMAMLDAALAMLVEARQKGDK